MDDLKRYFEYRGISTLSKEEIQSNIEGYHNMKISTINYSVDHGNTEEGILAYFKGNKINLTTEELEYLRKKIHERDQGKEVFSWED